MSETQMTPPLSAQFLAACKLDKLSAADVVDAAAAVPDAEHGELKDALEALRAAVGEG